MAEEDYTHKTTITPLTGKAASGTNGSGNSGNIYGDIKTSFNDLLQRGQIGVPREFSMITKDD